VTTPLAIAPMPASGLCAGVSASGVTQPLKLPTGETFTLVSAVSALSSGASIVVSLVQGGAAGWTPILTLPSQNAAGVEQESVQLQDSGGGPLAIAWTLSGTSPQVDIAAFAVADG
jgi:hypothetical protein